MILTVIKFAVFIIKIYINITELNKDYIFYLKWKSNKAYIFFLLNKVCLMIVLLFFDAFSLINK